MNIIIGKDAYLIWFKRQNCPTCGLTSRNKGEWVATGGPREVWSRRVTKNKKGMGEPIIEYLFKYDWHTFYFDDVVFSTRAEARAACDVRNRKDKP